MGTSHVRVLAAVVDHIVRLDVSRPPQTDRALAVPGQCELPAFHVTLLRLDLLGLTVAAVGPLPSPPSHLGLRDPVYLVDSGSRRSCYVEVDAAGQVALRHYVRDCSRALHLDDVAEPKRIFHVSLSNAGGGAPRKSVGPVWEYPPRIV